MNPLFTEITESEATSVVGGFGYLPPANDFTVQALAGSSAYATTEFFNTGYPETYTFASTAQNDVTSLSSSGSQSRISYFGEE